MTIGILSLQGDYPEQRRAIARVTAEPTVLIRTPKDLETIEALILPGGETTTHARLLVSSGLAAPLAERIRSGLPVLATCAGLLLLASRLEAGPTGHEPASLGVLDVTLRRNDYGSQRDSFEAPIVVAGISGAPFPGVFIRAPRILLCGPGVEPLARRGEELVGVKCGPIWGLTFHPELTSDSRLHALWLASFRPPVAAKAPSGRRSTPARTPPGKSSPKRKR
ncbi:MAG: pyridoxal 5'-phosphate synthase glutaminase subunit PdxT [Thermoplasmata archaeon]|nr:pyridoxal 5'-phosphate synthase glutaminase subunit PdxT [Thermoplasmata archaeon]